MYYTQTDQRWYADIMTSNMPEWRDYIGRWGCLVTCIANIANNAIIGCNITPQKLNNDIKKINGYAYLNDKATPEHTASFLVWDKIKNMYKAKFRFFLFLNQSDYIHSEKSYYIARILHKKLNTGHYINVICRRGDFFTCFDVETGLLEQHYKDNITLLHKIEVI